VTSVVYGRRKTTLDAGRVPVTVGRASVAGVNTIVKFALRVVVLAVIIYAVTRLVDGIYVLPDRQSTLGVTGTYLWVALLFALVNSIVGPVLRLLSLPFVMLTLGLFLLVVNAALLGITAALSTRLDIDGVWAAIVGGFLIALFSWIAELLLPLKVRAG
jgi:putative membrane protein